MLSLGNKLTLNTQPIYKFVNKYSVDFDGVDDRIITDGADTVAQPTTYSFWCKASTTGDNLGVFGHGNTFVGAFHFNAFGGNRPILYLEANYYRYWDDTSAQDDGEWHHWVVYSDPNDITNSKLYVDGVLQTVSSTTSTGSSNAYTESLTIGSDRQSGGNSFEGKIDEFAVYDRELTQAEITRMYNTYYSPNRVANGNFAQEGVEEVTNGDFSQIGSEEITNGDFANWSGGLPNSWNQLGGSGDANNYIEEYQGKLRIVSNGGSGAAVEQNALIVGKIYKVTADLVVNSGGGMRFQLGANSTHHIYTTTQSIEFYAECDGTNGYLQIIRQGTTDFTIDNVSVKEVGQDWTIEDVWTIGDNVANGNGANGSTQELQSNINIPIGTYKITYEIKNYVSGSVAARLGGDLGYNSGNGIYTHTTTTTQVTNFKFRGLNFDGSVTNISVKEVGQHWTSSNPGGSNGWRITGTNAICDSNAATANRNLESAFSLVSGKDYKLTIDILQSTYAMNIYIGGTLLSAALPTGTNLAYEYLISGADHTGGILTFYAGTSATQEIDNVVLQELKHDATNLMLNAGDYQSANPLITSTKSMEFDGTDDYLQLSEPFSHTNHTITGWFKADVTNATLLIFDAADINVDGIRVYVHSSGVLRYRIGDGTASTLSSSAIEANKWYNFAATYDGTTQILYLDGVDVANTTITKTISTTTDVNIGKISYTTGANFNGKITEVGAFNRALTALEVASLYNQGVPTNLLVNRNNYQSGNPTVFNTKQVDFDGTDDYLELGSQSGVLTLANSNGSISAWIKPTLTGDSYQRIVDKSTDGGGLNGYALILHNDGAVQAYMNGSNIVNSTTNLVAAKWQHIIWSWNGTSHNLYIDGVLSSTVSSSATPPSVTTNMRIGSWNHSTGREYSGEISQIGVWNEALTADEVSSLYNHGLPIDLTTDQAAYESSSNLVGYWRMGSGTLDTYPLIADQKNATLGSELVTNGDFATDSDWTKGSGWSITNGEAVHTGSGDYIEQGSLTEGNIYKVVVVVTQADVSGFPQIYMGGLTTAMVSPDTYTFYITAQSGDKIKLRGLNDCKVDSISVKQINGNPAIMTNQTSSDIENGSPYANIVQNGTFDTDSDWAKQAGWTISGGTANFVEAGGNRNIYQNILTVGKIYKLTYTVLNYVSGSIRNISTATPIQRTANGTYTEFFTAYQYTNLFLNCTVNSQLSIDNVTVEEVNTGLQGYWKMGDGTNDEYPVIYDQVDPTLGSELVTNGDFATDSDWNKGSNWTIANGLATRTSGVTSNISQVISDIGGKTLKVSYTVSNYGGDGNIGASPNGSDFNGNTGNGTFTDYITPTGNNLYIRASYNFSGSIDNVSVKQVQGNPATMTNMVEGNITNQYPLTKIRNYYRMGDGILDGYPIIQDQTSPNLAHIPTTNLITSSESFVTGWGYTGVTSSSASSITDPFGNNDAIKLIESATTAFHFASFGLTLGSEPHTVSCYIKAAERTTASMFLSQSGNVGAIYDLSSGTVTSVTGTGNTASIENVGNGWFRCKLNNAGGADLNDSIRIGIQNGALDSYAGDGSSGIYVFGSQLEQQSQATAYIKSDGIAAVRKSSTTNLIPYSEDFSQWTTSNFTANSETTSSPNGETVNGYDFGDGFIYIDTSDVIINKTYTSSIYIKANKSATVGLRKGGAGSYTDNADITLTTDWARYEGISTAGSTRAGRFLLDNRTANGYGVSDLKVFIWHPQLEEQTQAETYAPTTGLPVTIDLFTENNYGTMTNMSASDIVEDTP